MTVLLVEDDPSISIVITAALEAEGFSVTRCDSIADRDRLLANQAFEALVTDVMLTDGDGIETIGRVRELAPDMPVIILSAQNTLDTAVRLCRYMLDSDGIIQAIDLFAHQKVSFGARSTQSEQAYLLSKVLTF